MSHQNLLGLASLDTLRESQLLQYHPAYSWHTQKRLLHFFRASYHFLENQFLGEAPPSVCIRCWNFFLHRTIYSGLRLHAQGTPSRPMAQALFLLSSVLYAVLQPLLLQYTAVLKSVLLQYTNLLISVHHGALLMQYTTCAKIL